jgi:hypothetical protein
MKAIITFAGILLLAAGCYFVFDGYQVRQTATAKIEKEVSSIVKAISDDTIQTKNKVNNESAMKMIGGGVAGITGIVLLLAGTRRRRR